VNSHAEAKSKRYAAFISYSHVDQGLARWLHRAIESYRVPATIRELKKGAAGARRSALAPVFIDRAELSSSADLANSVRSALQESEFLVVVCSPTAARSRWVNEEVRSFKALGGANRILCVIAAGEPGAVARGFPADQECFPPALRYEVDDGHLTDRPASEPLAADVRAGADTRADAKLKVVAGLLGVGLDEIRRRDQARRQRQLMFIGAAATVGCVVFASLALLAWLARNEAEAQRQLATQKSLTARRTADFMISLFKESDPSEARGNSITAREILDRGARQIDESLRAEPQVRAELSAALGEVYTGLGLYEPAHTLLAKARAVSGQSDSAQMAQAISLAELEFQRGNYDQSELLLASAARESSLRGNVDQDTRARILLDRGEVAAVQERAEDASRYFNDALALPHGGAATEVTARAYEGLALARWYANDMREAERWYDRALAERIEVSGESHPRVTDLLNLMGSIAFMDGKTERAESLWLKALEIDRRVRGPDHPDVAGELNNLARARLERREFLAAQAYLDKALAILLPQRGETHDDLVFVYTNLAIAHMQLGHYDLAEPLFQKGLRAAIVNKHRLHAPILADLADLECRTSRYERGLRHLEEARPMMAERYPDDPWRVAHVDSVRAGCLMGLKHYADARPLIESSMPALMSKWSPDSLYGHDALERATRLSQVTGDTLKLADYRKRQPQAR
jgi:Tetratricopeptide repeat/TIR domain